MTIRLTLNSFLGGEVDDDDLGFRTDVGSYQHSLKSARNFFCSVPGPIVKRGGWEVIAQHDASIRIIEFGFSVDQFYLLSMGNSSCTVYRGDTLASVATFAIPWSDAQLPYVRFAQQGDTMYLVHPDIHPKTIKRGGSHTSWTLADVSFEWPPFFSFYGEYSSDITLLASNNTGTITLTASANLFTAGWVGKQIELNGGWCTITAYTNATEVTATVNERINRIDEATNIWAENAFSAARGWPRTVQFFGGRLYYGGSKTLPATVWGSRVGVYNSFCRATDLSRDSDNQELPNSIPKKIDSDAMVKSIGSARIVTISDIVTARRSLAAVSNSGEFIVTAKPITPDSLEFTQTSNVGASINGIQALSLDSEVLYVGRTGMEVRAFNYNLQNDDYVSENLSVTNPTIINQPVASAFVRGLLPATTHAMFANADGSVAVLCIDANQKVRGWSRLIPATGCEVKSLTAMGGDTTMYGLIAYDGHRYICRLSKDVYLDMFQSGSDTAKATWTGFTLFANKTVTVVGDGYVFSNVAVNGSGQFTLPAAVASVKVGLPYTALAETLPLSPVFNGQLQRGRKQLRKIAAELVVRNTADIWVDGRRVPPKTLGNSLLDQPPQAVDTTFRILLNGIGREPTVVFESREPLPCSLAGAVIELKGPGLG